MVGEHGERIRSRVVLSVGLRARTLDCALAHMTAHLLSGSA
ncbi:hypothetical protein [Halocatena marina]|uniref:Uncharacterized protein n=1 Tax=Halocatena marina TaxID=2934937 RepID=A0ABD5YSH7_9EURY|nr:hypothetical protein [Halocatena marina]